MEKYLFIMILMIQYILLFRKLLWNPSQYFDTLISSVSDICFTEFKEPRERIIFIVTNFISQNI